MILLMLKMFQLIKKIFLLVLISHRSEYLIESRDQNIFMQIWVEFGRVSHS